MKNKIIQCVFLICAAIGSLVLGYYLGLAFDEFMKWVM